MVIHQEKTEASKPSIGRKIFRTLLVDDHELFRDGLSELLVTEPDLEICGEAESEDEAMEKFRELTPDVVTVDISLASGQGLSLVGRIKTLKPDTIVLVL